MIHSILFADASSNFTFNWNTAINAVMAIGTIGLFFLARRKQSVEVTPGFVPVSKKDFDEHAKRNAEEHDKIFSKIGGVERGSQTTLANELKDLRLERKTDITLLHEKINKLGEAVAGLDKETELQNQKMASMDSKLDRLIERPSLR